MARRAAADRNPRGGSARSPARRPLRALRGVRPPVAHALTFKERVSHGDLATELSADSAEPAPSVAGPERLTCAHRATRTLPVFPFGGSRAGIRRDSAFQSAVPPRSFRLRVSGAVAPSAPAPGGTGLSRGDRPAVTAMIGAARPLSTAGRGGRGHPRHRPPSTSPRRWAEGYDDHTLVARRYDALQRHLGAGPRDTGLNCHTPVHIPSLQRHLGARPRDTPTQIEAIGRYLGLQRHLGAGPRDTYPGTNPWERLGGLQRHLGAGSRDTPTPRSTSTCSQRPFNVTSALGRGIHPHPPLLLLLRLPSTSPRHLAEGYVGMDGSRTSGIQPSTSPRRLAEGYVGMDGSRTSGIQPSTSPRRLAEGYGLAVAARRIGVVPSTSPRRLAEGYPPVDAAADHRGSPSTSPRRLAEGYREIVSWKGAAYRLLQRHLGAWPRDTTTSALAFADATNLQRHLGAGPRDTARSPASARSSSRPFIVTSALGRGIRHRRARHRRRHRTFNVTSALGRGIPSRRPRKGWH